MEMAGRIVAASVCVIRAPLLLLLLLLLPGLVGGKVASYVRRGMDF